MYTQTPHKASVQLGPSWLLPKPRIILDFTQLERSVRSLVTYQIISTVIVLDLVSLRTLLCGTATCPLD